MEEKRKQQERDAEAKRRQSEAEAKRKAERVAIEVLKVRLEPIKSADGADAQIVCVDWKNTGDRPVRAVTADIKSFDGDGVVLYCDL